MAKKIIRKEINQNHSRKLILYINPLKPAYSKTKLK